MLSAKYSSVSPFNTKCSKLCCSYSIFILDCHLDDTSKLFEPDVRRCASNSLCCSVHRSLGISRRRVLPFIIIRIEYVIFIHLALLRNKFRTSKCVVLILNFRELIQMVIVDCHGNSVIVRPSYLVCFLIKRRLCRGKLLCL